MTIIPQNLEAEEAVIGAILSSPAAFDAAVDATLSPSDFHSPQHSFVYQQLASLNAAGKPVDERTLIGLLGEVKSPEPKLHPTALAFVGGAHTIVDYSAKCPVVGHAGEYAKQIVDARRRRDVYDAAVRIRELIDKPGLPTAELEALAGGYAAAIGARLDSATTGLAPLEDDFDSYYDQLSARYDESGGAAALATGFEQFDATTGGMLPGSLWVVGGRPAMGKTSWGMNVAESVAERGVGVAVFSLEMSRQELVNRFVAGRTRITAKRLRTAKLAADEFARVSEAMGSWRDLHGKTLHVDSVPGARPHQLAVKLRRLQQRVRRAGSPPIGLVVVDYLGLMHADSRCENRNIEVGEISRAMKALAIELDTPIMLLSQLNRGVESRPDKRPTLRDLRDSGSVEQDADVVVFLYRDHYYHPDGSADPAHAEAIIAKNRHGEGGVTVPLRFDAAYTRFSSWQQIAPVITARGNHVPGVGRLVV